MAWIRRCCGCGVCRPVATAPIQLLAWEPPYAAGAAQEIAKKTKKKKKKISWGGLLPIEINVHVLGSLYLS